MGKKQQQHLQKKKPIRCKKKLEAFYLLLFFCTIFATVSVIKSKLQFLQLFKFFLSTNSLFCIFLFALIYFIASKKKVLCKIVIKKKKKKKNFYFNFVVDYFFFFIFLSASNYIAFGVKYFE